MGAKNHPKKPPPFGIKEGRFHSVKQNNDNNNSNNSSII